MGASDLDGVDSPCPIITPGVGSPLSWTDGYLFTRLDEGPT